MVVENHHVDRVFHALADATRRDIVSRALTGAESVSAIARRYPMSFAAVQKHVAVLEAAGLVTKRKHGREQLVEATPAAIARVHGFLDDLETRWRDRLDRFGQLLAEDPSAQGDRR